MKNKLNTLIVMNVPWMLITLNQLGTLHLAKAVNRGYKYRLEWSKFYLLGEGLGKIFYVVAEKVDANTNPRGCNSRRLADMRGLRLRAEKVAPVGGR